MRIEELDTPAVLIDLDILENNIRSLADYTKQHGFGLRPHTKTHKIPEIAKMQIEAGSHGVTVAKTGEAEVMAAAGIDDILIAYPVLGQDKFRRLTALARDTKITISLDSIEVARAVSEAASHASVNIGVLTEFDVGMHRCGVQSADAVKELAAEIGKLPGLKFRGVMLYPGHIWDAPDQQGDALHLVGEKVTEVVDTLRKAGIEFDMVSGGSTPTAYTSHQVPHLTEIRPGTYVFNDRNTMGMGGCVIDDCAVRIQVTVVSNAVPGKVIVDAGSKTFSGDRWISGDKTGFGLVVEHPEIRFEAMSEEHGHMHVPDGNAKPSIGDRVTIIPNHVCPCVNMHDAIWTHRKGIVEGCWKVAGRGRVR